MNKIGAIILAAGSSSRLGQPKQLIDFEGKSLIRRVIARAQEAELDPIVVVTGSNSAEVENEIDPEEVTILYNADWESGMGSAISLGAGEMFGTQAVFTLVCDQPFITADLLNEMKKVLGTDDKHLVACSYADTIGTPALFGRKYYEDLRDLTGEGAKSLLKKFEDDLIVVPFENGKIDIDTREDYLNLVNGVQKHSPAND